jgi:lipoate-protein ligase A
VDWDVEVVRGAASVFHSRVVGEVPSPALWWFEVESPSLVLGSTQNRSVVDLDACDRLGVEVAQRSSGGGAVLLVPDEVAWFDLVIPRGHPRWDDDVTRAAWWVGDLVSQALGDGGLVVHRGPMERSPWSGLVCFAGLGPGEVTRAGRKVLGLSQRRTRHWIRYQCAIYRTWSPSLLVELLADPKPSAGDLAPLVGTAELRLDDVLAALRSAD